MSRISISLSNDELPVMSSGELEALTASDSKAAVHFRRCALGILGAYKGQSSTERLATEFPAFQLSFDRSPDALEIHFDDAPRNNCVGRDVLAVKKTQIGAALRDVLLSQALIEATAQNGERTHMIKTMLDRAGFLTGSRMVVGGFEKVLQRVVTWGGHTVGPEEYDYCMEVCDELGRRLIEVISGGGPGTMKGALKGNMKGFNVQEAYTARQYGLTALEIILEEPTNQYARLISIMPTIEARLEAFLRLANAVVIFPGGAGTAEEFLMALSLRMHSNNADQYLPIIITAPAISADWVEALDECVVSIFGPTVRQYYKITIDDAAEVADYVSSQVHGIGNVPAARKKAGDSLVWNGSLYLPEELQSVFVPDHEAMSQLDLCSDQEPYQLAANIRRMFKGIVWGSITQDGISRVQKEGRFPINGDKQVIEALQSLLDKFIAQRRMTTAETYEPCWEVST